MLTESGFMYTISQKIQQLYIKNDSILIRFDHIKRLFPVSMFHAKLQKHYALMYCA